MRVGPLPVKQYPLKNSNTGRLEARIMGKTDSKSNQVQPTSSLKNHLISSEEQKISTLLRSWEDMDAALKKPHPLKKKVEVPKVSPSTRLKAMPELAHKEIKRSKEQSKFDQGEAINVRKDGTEKLDLPKSSNLSAISKKPNTLMEHKLVVSKNNCSDECKDKHVGVESSKGNCKDHASGGLDIHGALHKPEDNKSLNGNQPMQGLRNSGKSSSKTFDEDLSRR